MGDPVGVRYIYPRGLASFAIGVCDAGEYPVAWEWPVAARSANATTNDWMVFWLTTCWLSKFWCRLALDPVLVRSPTGGWQRWCVKMPGH